MSRIYLCENFNNLSNKMCIVYDRIELYPNPVFEATVNFRPGDGVSTTLVLMYKDNVLAPPVNLEPDYAIVCADSGGGIESRWFVTESVRLSDSKFSLQLQRDVAADYKSNIMNSVAFVRRGWVDKANPLIFNSENGNYSQILRERIDLKDKSGKGCYVAFLAPNFIKENTDKLSLDLTAITAPTDINFAQPADTHAGNYKYCYGADPSAPDPVSVFLRTYNHWGLPNTPQGEHSYIKFTIGPFSPVEPYKNQKYEYTIYDNGAWDYKRVNQLGTETAFPDFVISPGYVSFFSPTLLDAIGRTVASNVAITLWQTDILDEQLFNTGGGIYGTVETMKFMAPRINLRARVGGEAAGAYYMLDQLIVSESQSFEEVMVDALREQFVSIVLTSVPNTSVSPLCPNNQRASVHYSFRYGAFHWRQIYSSSLQIPATGTLVQESPYYMLCIPEVGTKLQVGNQNWVQQVDAFQIYNQLQVNFSTFVYDVQYVPYTPYATDIAEDGTVVLSDLSQIGFAKASEGTIEAGVYFCNRDRFWFTVEPQLPEAYESLSAIKTKVSSETNFARICSMDSNSILTVNLAKNNGLAPLRINCRYAPYQSYISIQPQWSIYYGTDIGPKDTRGLNITTSNSVTRVSNQWQEYVLSNANFQSIFDRQIQSMDTQFDIQADAAVRNMVFGLLNTGSAAAMSGSPSSVIGGGLGLIQQGQNYVDMVDRFRENRSLSTDMFNLQNGNIKARADTLSKVNAMSPIYNTWPYIEVYETTPEERAALTTYITEFSMNIGALTSQLSAYVTPNPNARKYIQADIVRLNGKFDAHMAEVIKSVISNGIYFVEVTTNE